jgi:hypothetical protein
MPNRQNGRRSHGEGQQSSCRLEEHRLGDHARLLGTSCNQPFSGMLCVMILALALASSFRLAASWLDRLDTKNAFELEE